MAEELRIVVVEDGRPAQGGATAPTTPRQGASSATRGGATTPAQGGATAPTTPGQGASSAARGGATTPVQAFSAQTSDVTASASAAATRALGGFAVAIGAATVGVTAMVSGVRSFARVIEGEVSRLSAFSADVALAQAQSDIRLGAAQRRRASRIGPDLARAERIRSEFSSKIFDVNTELLGIALKIFNTLEPLADIVGSQLADLNDLSTNRQKQIDLLVRTLIPGGLAMVAIKKILLGEIAKREEDADEDEFTKQFLSLLPRDEDDRPLFWPGDLAEPGI